MKIKVGVPTLVVSVAVAIIATAGICGGVGKPGDPCASGGCTVPVESPAPPNSAFELSDCRATHDKGPCAVWWPDVEGVCRWWYVGVGSTLDNGAKELAVSDEGVECQDVTRLPVPPWAEGPIT